VLLSAAGRDDEAIRCLQEALVEYGRLAARRGVARTRRRLRQLGVRRRHGAGETKPTGGWAALTDVEQATARLVAEGLTNQQIADQRFISTHTVAFHLRQMFRKLDISSRVDLARVALEHPGPGTGNPRNADVSGPRGGEADPGDGLGPARSCTHPGSQRVGPIRAAGDEPGDRELRPPGRLARAEPAWRGRRLRHNAHPAQPDHRGSAGPGRVHRDTWRAKPARCWRASQAACGCRCCRATSPARDIRIVLGDRPVTAEGYQMVVFERDAPLRSRAGGPADTSGCQAVGSCGHGRRVWIHRGPAAS
jgi:DNA-binding CsgD family transcriptional regulator